MPSITLIALLVVALSLVGMWPWISGGHKASVFVIEAFAIIVGAIVVVIELANFELIAAFVLAVIFAAFASFYPYYCDWVDKKVNFASTFKRD